MADLQKEAYGPHGDSSHHHRLAERETGWRALPESPTDSGRLILIVRRLADGTRETPDFVPPSRDGGVPGDGWDRRPPRNPDAQLAVMNGRVAELIANGQPLTV